MDVLFVRFSRYIQIKPYIALHCIVVGCSQGRAAGFEDRRRRRGGAGADVATVLDGELAAAQWTGNYSPQEVFRASRATVVAGWWTGLGQPQLELRRRASEDRG